MCITAAMAAVTPLVAKMAANDQPCDSSESHPTQALCILAGPLPEICSQRAGTPAAEPRALGTALCSTVLSLNLRALVAGPGPFTSAPSKVGSLQTG